jgi:multiple sugar transport system substrate-binding protein
MGTVLTRRDLLKSAGSAAAAAGVAPSIIPGRARAQQKTLKLLHFKHFVPSFNEWFAGSYAKQWGEKNDTQVIVDYLGIADIHTRAVSEAEAGRGHDLVICVTPIGVYEDHVIDHSEIYEECEHRYGKAREFALRSTYNPKTKKFFGFMPSYQPPVIIYRKDLWDAARATPDSWSDVRNGGRQIRLQYDKPVGISLAPEDNSNQTILAIMYSYGASEQDEDGRPALKSKEMLEVVEYVKALYNDAMTSDVLTWDAASNNRFMLNGDGSLTLDTISIARASENMKLPFADDLQLAKAPAGPSGRLAPPFGFHAYFIWNFADNVDGAKKFLVDYIGQSREAFLASGFQNMPAFPDTVPNLATLVANGARASPPDKYALLAEVASWTTNVGYPGYTNPAISEIFQKGLIPTMCARAATGQLTPEDALDQADREVRAIFQNWKERGKI